MQTQSMFDSSSYCFLLYSCCMSRIESGKANCTVPQLYCIAQLLNCSVDFLLFGEEHVNYSPEMVGLINDIFTDVGKLKESIIK